MPPDLAARWVALLGACGVEPALAEPVRAALLAAYGEPHRTYHRLPHVAHVLAELEPAPLAGPTALWAAWFHDVVYVPGRPDNEVRSAARARAALADLGLPHLAPRTEALVLATRDHGAVPGDVEAALFLDADLAILGAPPDAYRAYADAVRAELGAFPDFIFRRGRRRFLGETLARETIFATAHFRERYERRARENLAAELARLGG